MIRHAVYRAIGLIAAVAAILTSGCGGGSGTIPISQCALDSFTPNYATNVTHLLTWTSFPIRVYFQRDPNYTTDRENQACTGFNEWVTAVGNAITYQVTTDPSAAQVTVRFTTSTDDGETVMSYSGLDMISANITLGVETLGAEDLRCTAAHEMGHALGIQGHSDVAADIMYPVHYIGTDGTVTERDRNTLETCYCGLFGRAAATGKMPREGPVTTVRIR